MRLAHVDDIIRTVPARFRETYAHYDKDHRFPASSGPGPRSIREIEAALEAAGSDLSAIKAALPTWCVQSCDECGEGYDVLVRLGEEPDYEARWQDLCGACLSEALRLLNPAGLSAGVSP